MKEKNKLTWRNRPLRGRLTWLLALAVLALAWPGYEVLASTLLSEQVSGVVHLQGRMDHSDIGVQIQIQPDLNQAQAADDSPPPPLSAAVSPEGAFYVDAQGTLVIMARRLGYLNAQATVTITPGEPLNLGPTVLYGGEVTGDNLIDISDMAYLGAHFHTDNFQGDINGDGQIDILDLSIAAANFSMSGPTPWGE